MVKATEKAGFKISFGRNQWRGQIIAVAKAYKIFTESTLAGYIQVLEIIRSAWNGEPDSLRAEILGGISYFQNLYDGEFDSNALAMRLLKVSPMKIIRDGKANALKGDARYAKEIFDIYNKNTRVNKLVYKFQ